MNKEDFINYLTLSEQVFGVARARLKAHRILSVNYENEMVEIIYLPDGDITPKIKYFTIEEFTGD